MHKLRICCEGCFCSSRPVSFFRANMQADAESWVQYRTFLSTVSNSRCRCHGKRSEVFDLRSSEATQVIGANLPDNVLYFPGRCMIHQIFRSIVQVLEKYQFMRQLFCVTQVFQAQSHKERILKSLRVVVDHDFTAGGGFILGDPPERCRRSEQWLVRHLLWRRQFRDDASSVFANSSETAVLERGKAILDILQGPWHAQKFQHYCSGPGCVCGGSREACIESVFSLLAWLLVFSIPSTPSFSRWLGNRNRIFLQPRGRSLALFSFSASV